MSRLDARSIVLSLASLPFLLPHVIEDFDRGIAARVGLSTGVGAAALGLWLAVQFFGLVMVAQGRRVGLVVTAVAGAVWMAGALWDHGPELLATGFGFRGSALSALWVTGLMITQGLAAVCAVVSLTRRRAEHGP